MLPRLHIITGLTGMAYGSDPVVTLGQGVATRRTVSHGNALAIVSMLAWSAGFPAAEVLLQTWPPLTLITARLLLALTILIPLWAIVEGPTALRHARWGRGMVVGGVCFGAGTYLLLVAQSLTDPVTVALIASCAPVAATLIELMQRQRRLTLVFAAGLLVALAGGVLATLAGSAGQVGQLGLGALAAVLSAFLFCWGSMAAVRDFPDLGPVGRSAITLAGAAKACAILLLLSHLAGLDLRVSAPVSGAQIGYLLIYAVAGMALSQVMWIASVSRLGVALASFHMNAAPFYVMLILLALGGGWSWAQAAGALIVVCGVLLAQRG